MERLGDSVAGVVVTGPPARVREHRVVVFPKRALELLRIALHTSQVSGTQPFVTARVKHRITAHARRRCRIAAHAEQILRQATAREPSASTGPGLLLVLDRDTSVAAALRSLRGVPGGTHRV